MPYDCWRGMVGIIKPTKGSGSLVELIKMLPDGIGVIPLFNNVRHGKIEEFQAAIQAYEEKIAELAEDKVDLIHPAGTPPFMLLGYKGEAEIIAKWEKQFGIPIFTSATNQVAAMKALKIQKFVGIGYDFDDNRDTRRTVTFVSNFVELFAVFALARAAFDRAFDIVIGHALGARRQDRTAQTWIGTRIAAAGFCRESDFLR